MSSQFSNRFSSELIGARDTLASFAVRFYLHSRKVVDAKIIPLNLKETAYLNNDSNQDHEVWFVT